MSFKFDIDNIINIDGRRVRFPWFLITELRAECFAKGLHTRILKGDLNGKLKICSSSKFDIIRLIPKLKEMGIPYFFPRSNFSCFKLQDPRSLYPERFEDLRAYTLDIETTGLDLDSSITAIGVLNHLNDEIAVFTGSEKKLLKEFSDWLLTAPIDVLVTHNGIKFDFPMLKHRASVNTIPLFWGTKKAVIDEAGWDSFFRDRFGRVQYRNITMNGIDIIDTIFLAWRYDTTFRTLPGYGLKKLETYFNLAEPDRLVLTGKEIVEYGKSKSPEKRRKLIKYLRGDLVSTKRLYELLAPVEFYQTRVAPLSFQEMHQLGIGKKWDYTMLAEYLQAGHSIPVQHYQKRTEKYEGADVECFYQGRVENVHKIDVSSLYPSIIKKYEIKPSTDPLNVYLPKLTQVLAERLKRKKQAVVDPTQKPVEKALKIFINGGYGYLGDANSLFKNEQGAADVCTHGRKILGVIKDVIEESGGKPIEMDTDGIIYTGDGNIWKDVNKTLPEGISVDYEGSWQVMLSYKAKNYILWNENEKPIVKGVFFKNSKSCKLKKEFIAETIDAMLRRKPIVNILSSYYSRIELGELEIDDIKMRYNFKSSPMDYMESFNEKPNKHPNLPYQLFIDRDLDFAPGDVVNLFQARAGKVYEGAEIAENFDGIYDKVYYHKSLFKFIEQIFKNAPRLLPADFVSEITGYHYWRYKFTGVQTKELREAVKEEKIFL